MAISLRRHSPQELSIGDTEGGKMMLVPLLIALTLAGIAIFVSYSVTEEIKLIGAILIAVFCLLFSLFFSPMLVKGIILIFLLLNSRIIYTFSLKK